MYIFHKSFLIQLILEILFLNMPDVDTVVLVTAFPKKFWQRISPSSISYIIAFPCPFRIQGISTRTFL